jgi:hypothetical protein
LHELEVVDRGLGSGNSGVLLESGLIALELDENLVHAFRKPIEQERAVLARRRSAYHGSLGKERHESTREWRQRSRVQDPTRKTA